MTNKKTNDVIIPEENVITIETPEENYTEDKPRRLYRSENDRMLAGVCGGIAEFFGWDSTLIRLMFILIILLGGSGVLVYLILWVVLPNQSEALKGETNTAHTASLEIKKAAQSIRPNFKKSNRSIWGIFLIGLGIVILLQNFGVAQYLQLDKTWPIVLVILGFLILTK